MHKKATVRGTAFTGPNRDTGGLTVHSQLVAFRGLRRVWITAGNPAIGATADSSEAP